MIMQDTITVHGCRNNPAGIALSSKSCYALPVFCLKAAKKKEKAGAMSDSLTTPRPVVRPSRCSRERLKKRATARNAPVLRAIVVGLAGDHRVTTGDAEGI